MSFKLRELGRIQFFQSSLPYLNNNAVTKFQRHKTRRWRSEDPHPSNHKYPSISNGHYGIYFTIFNHELRREEKNGLHDHGSQVFLVFPASPLIPLSLPYFVISKVKDEVYSHINQLKTVSKEFLSSWALVKPKNLLQQPYFVRQFSTSAPELDHEHRTMIPLSRPKIEELAEEPAAEDVPFAESFQKSQSDKILVVYNSHASPEDLDIIYPLYQALKRNEIPLPSIQLYNIVLESILTRALDSDRSSLAAIESRLTNLLTVYQDILHLCSSSSLRPDNTTYDLVLKGIFEGCVQTVGAGRSPSVARHIYEDFEAKAKEFGQVGTDLFLSLKDYLNLLLSNIIPPMVTAVTNFPELLSADLVGRILDHRSEAFSDGSLYIGLIDLSKHFASLGMPNLDKEEVYKYLVSLFETFKSNTQKFPELISHEYNVYSALILALITNGNLPLATKFLDDILNDYKASLQASDKNIVVAKQKVSALLSVYLEAMTSSGSTDDLHRAYNLLNKFSDVPYLPELSTQLYNILIGLFINEYCMIEMQKGETKGLESQRDIYNVIWKLYDKVAIRSDYQNNLYDATIFPKKFTSCRESLLALSIDLADHSKVFRLIKEVIAKDHIITDWNVSKKLMLFLINSARSSVNGEYLNLCWTILEQQAAHYGKDSSLLNAFISEHLPYFVHISPEFALERFLDSKMVSDAFAKFNLEQDNIYGLMSVMTYLMNIAGSRELSPEAKVRLLRYQACLLNEFEDTENHYLQLSEDLEQFKFNVKSSFTWLIASLPETVTLSQDIRVACGLLDIAVPDFEQGKAIISMDYSHLLAINYEKGVETFENAFKAGLNFNALTWKLIINRNFVIGTLAKDNTINTRDFVSRLLGLSLELNEKHILLRSLISLENEKVIIEILKTLLRKDETGALLDARVLDGFTQFLQNTENSYFLSILEGAFERLLTSCESNVWVAKFLGKLLSLGKLKEALKYVPKDRIDELDVTSQGDLDLLASYLACLIDVKNDTEVMALMKRYFSGKEGNKVLMDSSKLLSIVVKFYISRGNYAIVVDRFGKMAGESESAEFKQLVKFASFMMQISGLEPIVSQGSDEDVATFALSLLSQRDSGSMSRLFEQNSRFLRTSSAIFDSMVLNLTSASKLSGDLKVIRAKFEAAIRLCKTMRMKELAVDALVGVIRLLGAMKARDLLNVLVNKFVNRGETAPMINLFFLQIRISSAHEAKVLKQEFEAALKSVDDKINLSRLAQA